MNPEREAQPGVVGGKAKRGKFRGRNDSDQPPRFRVWRKYRESDMISETEVHTIARQMIDQRGFEAIAEAARNAQKCEGQGESEEAGVWRRIEDAMKIIRGPHQS